MDPKTFVFVLGGPGSGKGTHCEKIVESFPGWTHISVGKLLRQAVANEPDKEWGKLMKEGKNVPTDDVLEVLEGAVKACTSSKLLIDGFPRTTGQTEAFQTKIGIPASAIYIEVPEDELKKRLLARGTESGREDDKEAVIDQRLETFKENILPCMDELKSIEKLHTVSGSGEIDAVFEQVKSIVKETEEGETSIEPKGAPTEQAAGDSPSGEEPAQETPKPPEQQVSAETESGQPEVMPVSDENAADAEQAPKNSPAQDENQEEVNGDPVAVNEQPNSTPEPSPDEMLVETEAGADAEMLNENSGDPAPEPPKESLEILNGTPMEIDSGEDSLQNKSDDLDEKKTNDVDESCVEKSTENPPMEKQGDLPETPVEDPTEASATTPDQNSADVPEAVIATDESLVEKSAASGTEENKDTDVPNNVAEPTAEEEVPETEPKECESEVVELDNGHKAPEAELTESKDTMNPDFNPSEAKDEDVVPDENGEVLQANPQADTVEEPEEVESSTPPMKPSGDAEERVAQVAVAEDQDDANGVGEEGHCDTSEANATEKSVADKPAEIKDPNTEDEAAIKIQASYKGHRARRELEARKKEKAEKQLEQEAAAQQEAAVLIQSAHRGAMARKKVTKMREERDNAVETSCVDASPNIFSPNRPSVREYMDSNVVPILRNALKSLNVARPADPLKFLADYLMEHRET